MADEKLSQLPVATTPLTGTELMYVVQGGASYQTTLADVLAGAGGGGTGNLLNAGTPTAGQSGVFVDATHIQGINVAHFSGSFDGGGSALTAATATPKVMPYAGTIHGWYLRGDISGTVTVDIQKATGAGAFTSITASAKPALTAALYATSTTLTGWTTTFAAGDSLRAVISGTPTSLTQVTLVVY